MIVNTFFKLLKRRLYTWKSLADSIDRIVRNQIDYITINKRYRTSIKSTKTLPGADVPTDHNLLIAEVRLHFKKIACSNNRTIKLDTDKLKDVRIQQQITNQLQEKLTSNSNRGEMNIEAHWEGIRNAVRDVQQTILREEI